MTARKLTPCSLARGVRRGELSLGEIRRQIPNAHRRHLGSRRGDKIRSTTTTDLSQRTRNGPAIRRATHCADRPRACSE